MLLVEKKFLVENDFFPPSGFPPAFFSKNVIIYEMPHTLLSIG
jgi:hypothetical protein